MASDKNVRVMTSSQLLKYKALLDIERKRGIDIGWESIEIEELELISGDGDPDCETEFNIRNDHPAWKELFGFQKKEPPVEKDKKCDVDILCDGGSIPCHRPFLRMSKFLDDLVTENLKANSPNKQVSISLTGVQLNHLKPVITLFYTGVCLINESDYDDVMDVMKLFKIEKKSWTKEFFTQEGRKKQRFRTVKAFRDAENDEPSTPQPASSSSGTGATSQSLETSPTKSAAPITSSASQAIAPPAIPGPSSSTSSRQVNDLPYFAKVPPLVPKKTGKRIQRNSSDLVNRPEGNDESSDDEFDKAPLPTIQKVPPGAQITKKPGKRIQRNNSDLTNKRDGNDDSHGDEFDKAPLPTFQKVPPGTCKNKAARIKRPIPSSPEVPSGSPGTKTGRSDDDENAVKGSYEKSCMDEYIPSGDDGGNDVEEISNNEDDLDSDDAEELRPRTRLVTKNDPSNGSRYSLRKRRKKKETVPEQQPEELTSKEKTPKKRSVFELDQNEEIAAQVQTYRQPVPESPGSSRSKKFTARPVVETMDKGNDEVHECKFCKKKAPDIEALKIHLENVCAKHITNTFDIIKKYCKTCQSFFKSYSALEFMEHVDMCVLQSKPHHQRQRRASSTQKSPGKLPETSVEEPQNKNFKEKVTNLHEENKEIVCLKKFMIPIDRLTEGAILVLQDKLKSNRGDCLQVTFPEPKPTFKRVFPATTGTLKVHEKAKDSGHGSSIRDSSLPGRAVGTQPVQLSDTSKPADTTVRRKPGPLRSKRKVATDMSEQSKTTEEKTGSENDGIKRSRTDSGAQKENNQPINSFEIAVNNYENIAASKKSTENQAHSPATIAGRINVHLKQAKTPRQAADSSTSGSMRVSNNTIQTHNASSDTPSSAIETDSLASSSSRKPINETLGVTSSAAKDSRNINENEANGKSVPKTVPVRANVNSRSNVSEGAKNLKTPASEGPENRSGFPESNIGIPETANRVGLQSQEPTAPNSAVATLPPLVVPQCQTAVPQMMNALNAINSPVTSAVTTSTLRPVTSVALSQERYCVVSRSVVSSIQPSVSKPKDKLNNSAGQGTSQQVNMPKSLQLSSNISQPGPNNAVFSQAYNAQSNSIQCTTSPNPLARSVVETTRQPALAALPNSQPQGTMHQNNAALTQPQARFTSAPSIANQPVPRTIASTGTELQVRRVSVRPTTPASTAPPPTISRGLITQQQSYAQAAAGSTPMQVSSPRAASIFVNQQLNMSQLYLKQQTSRQVQYQVQPQNIHFTQPVQQQFSSQPVSSVGMLVQQIPNSSAQLNNQQHLFQSVMPQEYHNNGISLQSFISNDASSFNLHGMGGNTVSMNSGFFVGLQRPTTTVNLPVTLDMNPLGNRCRPQMPNEHQLQSQNPGHNISTSQINPNIVNVPSTNVSNSHEGTGLHSNNTGGEGREQFWCQSCDCKFKEERTYKEHLCL